MTARTFIFAGGGTGGHIFPGLAVAEEIRRRESESRFLFICSQRPIDASILTKAQQPFLSTPAQPFGLRPVTLLRFLNRWGASVRTARAALREVRAQTSEVRVVTMGGFVAPPVAQAARAERMPVVMVNLDAVPGRANRWIARRAHGGYTTYAQDKHPNWRHLPPIVRADAIAARDARACRAALGLDPDRPTLVVLGGSQGAGSINNGVIELAAQTPALFTGWQVFHQSGAADAARVAAAYEKAGIHATVAPFTDQIGDVWGAAELVVARAGAGTVAEAWANAVPTIFLPYPHHRDNHQQANAAPLVQCGGAKVITDQIGGVQNAILLKEALTPLMASASDRSRMRQAVRSLGPANGAARLADVLMG